MTTYIAVFIQPDGRFKTVSGIPSILSAGILAVDMWLDTEGQQVDVLQCVEGRWLLRARFTQCAEWIHAAVIGVDGGLDYDYNGEAWEIERDLRRLAQSA